MPVSSDALLFALMHPEVGGSAPAVAARAWTVEPGVLVPLVLGALMYAIGVRRLWASGRIGAGVRQWQVACFAAGCAAVVAALMSPIDAVSTELAAVHMVQHELLMIVAAPLLVAGLPFVAFLFALPAAGRRRVIRWGRTRWIAGVWSALTAPALVWLLHAAALWVWHLPALYDAALRSEALHAAEHASFFITAALFWWGIGGGRYGRLKYGAAVVYVFATALHSSVLGAAMAIAPSAWYRAYAATTAAWGLTPLEDQQLAGLIMWVPAGLVFTAVGLLFFAAWLRESERRSRFARAVSAVAIAVTACAAGSCTGDVSAQVSAMTGGDPDLGPAAINRYGCGTCHTIPGIPSARGKVGPPLGGVASRVYLAGRLPNTPANMQEWIRHPHAHDPETVMPETGIPAQQARNVAAYLYTLR